MDNKPTRRSVLTQIGLTTGIGVIGLPALSRSGAAYQVTRDHHTILENTLYETDVSTIAAPNDGPTVVVVGGIHGNERGGIEAAHLATEYTIDRGTLVVIPEANKPAVKRDNNHGPNGDLNRQFPIGSEPTTMAARSIWDEVVDVDPDYLIDMHNATGIYGSDGIGQSIFPTSNVVSAAESTVNYMNTTYLPDTGSLSAHDFHIGPAISEQHPLLIHKAAADLDIDGWLTEVTRTALTVDNMAFLQDMMTRELLDHSGVGVVSEPAFSNPL